MPDYLRGTGVAMFTAIWAFTAVTLPPLFGAIADAYGDRALFLSAAVAALVGMCVWSVLELRLAHWGRVDARPPEI